MDSTSHQLSNLDPAILDALPVGVIVLDPQSGAILRCNRAASELAGAELPPWLTGVFEMEGVLSADPSGPVVYALRTGQPLRGAPAMLRRRLGVANPLVITVDLIRNASSMVSAAVVVLERAPRGKLTLAAIETALRESEERYRHAAQAGRVGVWDWEIGSAALFISPELRALLGCSETELPGTVSAWSSLVHPDDRERVYQAVQAHLRGETPHYEVEVRRRHRSGEYRWFMSRGTALRSHSGQAYRLTGSDTDIHDQRVASEKLRAEYQFRRAIEDSMVAGVAAIDLEGRQSYVNPSFARMVGFTEEELIGSVPPYPFWPPEHMTEIRSAFERTLSGELPPEGFELRLRRKDETRFDAHIMPARLLDSENRMRGWLVTVYDITERKRAQANLLYVMEHAHCLLWHATVQDLPPGQSGFAWDFSYFDEAAAQRFLPLELNAGETYIQAYYRHKPDEDKRLVDRSAAKALRGGHDHYSHEFRIRRADGEMRWLYEEVRLERMGPGAWRAAGFCTDITERKALEAELRRQMDALNTASQRKDDFLAMLAHELRNPLGVVSNAVHILAQPDAGGDARESALAVMRRQLRQQTRMVADLLDVSRITRGLVELQKEPTNLVDLVHDAVEDCRETLARGERKLEVDLPCSPVWVEGDPIRLAQILGNLLHNADKFTQPGDSVRICLRASGQDALLEVEDTGAGIPAETLPHIFDSFVQGDRTLARSTGGLGLGLALVQGLVKLHDGTVAASSGGPGKGSLFVVRLPVSAAALARIPHPEPSTATPKPGVRVLVIEDNVDAAETMQELLELAGCEAEVAYTGPLGIEAAERFRPDVVLCDIGLPGMDGYEVAGRLRSLELPLKRLVAVTGYGGDGDRRRSEEAGFDDHFTKPVDFDRLKALLASASE